MKAHTTQKRGLSRTRAVFYALFVATFLWSCGSSGKGDSLPVGTWKSPFNDTYTITRHTITYNGASKVIGYSADIIYINDSGLNAGDTRITPNNDADGTGFAVIRYTSVTDPGTGRVGAYNVFRWANGSGPQRRLLTQGYKRIDADDTSKNDNVVFDSADHALWGATTSEYFGYVGEYTLQD